MRKILFVLLLVFAVSAQAQKADRTAPVDFAADDFKYNDKTKTYNAKGNVELTQDGAKLYTDEVKYDQNADKINVKGGIKIIEKNGDTLTADRAKLTQGFQNAELENVKIQMSKNNRLTAEKGVRQDGYRHILENARFSPCKLCNVFGGKTPVWRLGAYEIEHDAKNKDMFYEHAWLEVFGMPIIYVPYFFHPAPDVKRRSGFLTPSFEQSSEFGFIARIPYYAAPSPSYDVTITPTIVSKEGTIFETEYRQKFVEGDFEMRGSIAQFDETIDGFEKNDWQGHIFARLHYQLDENWSAGFDINRVKDRIYLKKFDFSDEDTLTSKAYTQYLTDDQYFMGSFYKFQGLRSTDKPEEIPLVFPEFEYSLQSKPQSIGGTLSFDTRARAVQRKDGTKSQGITLQGKWERPFYTAGGHIYDVALSVQADRYRVQNEDEVRWRDESRLFPQASIGWRYPFVQYNKRSYNLIEPVVSVVFASDDRDLNNIPNEDSEGFVFDETNLFGLNRFAGSDLLTLGSHVDYGFNYRHFDPTYGTLEAFLGQSYRLTGESDASFPKESGLYEDMSDIVGKIRYAPGNYADFLYRFRFDDETGDAERSELGVVIRDPDYWVTGDYIYLVEQPGLSTTENREQVSGQVGFKINDYWSMSGEVVHSLADDDDGTRSAAFKFYYNDECLSLTLKAERSFTRDGELDPEDSINLLISLKNLGDSVK